MTMHVLVIGGTRGIGSHVVEQALEQGLVVTLLARDPSTVSMEHPNLIVMQGDVLDADAVRRSVLGKDVVVFTVGIPQTTKPVHIFSEGTKNVLVAMNETGVRFLIAVTGMGAGESKGHWGLLYKMLQRSFRIKTIYDDKDRQERIIQDSNVDWIIVRPLFLNDGPLTETYRVMTNPRGIAMGSISRADVAHFIVEQITSRTCLGQAPALSS